MTSTTYGTAQMTEAEYNTLSPKMKGYAHYLFGAYEGVGDYLKNCPYNEDDTPAEYSEFQQGQLAAMIEVQDGEE